MKPKPASTIRKFLLRHPTAKKLVSVITVMALSMVFLNLAFLLDFVYQNLIRFIISPFLAFDPFREIHWFPYVLHVTFIALVALLSRYIFRSTLHMILKAAYLTVPLAVIYVTIGIVTYPHPALAYTLGVLFSGLALYAIYRTTQHWIYFFAWGYISLMMLIGAITGTEI